MIRTSKEVRLTMRALRIVLIATAALVSGLTLAPAAGQAHGHWYGRGGGYYAPPPRYYAPPPPRYYAPPPRYGW